MTALSNLPKTTVWIWPTGLFPRRIIYYFRAKGISLSRLQQHNIHLIPVQLDPSSGLVSMSGYEARPTSCTLPIMRVEKPNGGEFWVRESLAILEYFEDLFSPEKGYKDLRGVDSEQRAKTRDVLSLLADATLWAGVQLMHSNPTTTSWSGLTVEQMSSSTATHAAKKFQALLSKLETWVEADVISKGRSSLAGEGVDVSLADVALMAQVDYMQMMYGKDWLAEHGVLRVWCERAMGMEWFIGSEVLKGVEEDGEWEGVFGV